MLTIVLKKLEEVRKKRESYEKRCPCGCEDVTYESYKAQEEVLSWCVLEYKNMAKSEGY